MNVIVGCGGFACEVGRAALETWGIAETEPLGDWPTLAYWSEQPADVAPDGRALRLPAADDLVHVAIGANHARQRIMSSPPFPFARWFSIIDARATVRGDATVGEGSYVGAGAVVASRAVVGRGVIVNYNCSVGHDVHLGDFAQLGPLANLCGRAEADTGAFVGASAVVLPGVFVGAWAVVGAGAVVTKDVPTGETWAGNPARRIK